jgi:hypothetical protein
MIWLGFIPELEVRVKCFRRLRLANRTCEYDTGGRRSGEHAGHERQQEHRAR